MKCLLATPVVLFMVWLAVGAVTGRVKARSCCSIPADRDLRLRDGGTACPAGTRTVLAGPTNGGVVPTGSAGTTPPQA